MASTFTDLGLELMATGENAGTWGTKTNANLSLIEQLTGGVNSQAVTNSGTPTALTIADGALTGTAQQRVIELSGTISGARIVTFPVLTENFYIIKNGTSGAYTLQIKAATGSGATVTFSATDKGYKLIYFDGVATNTGCFEATIGEANEVTLTGTQTLTNKTLTSPKIGTNILDTNGNELLAVSATGSAVNELTLSNAASGASPKFTATGGDTNIGITLTPKGTGEITIAAGDLNYGGAAVTATGTELNFSDLAALGTTAASKVFTANANNLTTISGAVLNTEDTLTDASTITWNVINSPVARVTLTANRTMAAPSGTGPAAGQFISILVIQDAGGTNTLAWNAVYEFTADTAPTLTSTGAKGDIFSFRYNGTKWLEIGRNLNLTLS